MGNSVVCDYMYVGVGDFLMGKVANEMSIEIISKLVEIMNENDLVEVELEEADLKIKLKKPGSNFVATQAMVAPNMSIAMPASAGVPAVPADDTSGLTPIPSPIVGTFYIAPSPEADPFVAVGDSVGVETVVCIVEAMKIMNEVKAEISGTIEKILVKNGEPVEYGQPLFLVKE